MKSIRQIENQNQIIISNYSNQEKQLLPLNVIISLALGAIVGITVIFSLLYGANLLMN